MDISLHNVKAVKIEDKSYPEESGFPGFHVRTLTIETDSGKVSVKLFSEDIENLKMGL